MLMRLPAVLFIQACIYVCARSSFTNCGGHMTEQAGFLSSPSIGGNYPNDALCEWSITVAEGQVIDLRFKTLDLDRTGDQSCIDYVTVYDGLSTNDLWLGSYDCGFNDDSKLANLRIRSTKEKMLVVFQSDHSVTRTGFTASYWAHACPPFMYGDENCNKFCSCIKNNTEYCDTFTGECHCKAGWVSSDCSVLNNHCNSPNSCPDLYAKCVNILGGFECQCPDGMIMKNGACADAGKCTSKKCSHACGVTSESQHTETCYCPKGMSLNASDGLTCVDCDNWQYGENCQYLTFCEADKTESYNKTNGLCHCKSNWQGPNCNDDVNECSIDKVPCNTSAECFNTRGSYQCLCFPGYENPTGAQCEECGQSLNGSSGTIISGRHVQVENYTKYFECSWTIVAPVGEVVSLSFQYIGLQSSCEDSFLEIYDVSNTSERLMQHVYNSAQGSIIRTSGNEMRINRIPARCNYQFGYQSSGFNATYWTHKCDPFMFNANCTKPCTCIQNNSNSCNSITGACACQSGWYGNSCEFDRDECNYALACQNYSICKNLPGSFECLCKEGLIKNMNNQCIAGNNTSYCTRNCSHVCVALTNQSITIEQCYCPTGMELDGDRCVDCKQFSYGPNCGMESPCVQSHTEYSNPVDGGCRCWPNWSGYYCSNDYDECSNNNYHCQANSECTNYAGGYSCVCKGVDGYCMSGNGTCDHIECLYELTNETGEIKSPQFQNYYINTANCSWNISVAKSYVISLWFSEFYTDTYNGCQNDYLDVYDGVDSSSRLIGHYCGSGVPSVIRSSGNHMYIVFKSDETRHHSYPYGVISGQFKAHECRGFTYGIQACDNSCKCVKENTVMCVNTNGQCVCKPGWTSQDCSVDVDECLGTNNRVCPPNSDCINNVGSYRCECHQGYKFDTSNKTCFVPFYPYGVGAEDTLLDDTYVTVGAKYVSGPIDLKSGAPIGNAMKFSAHVSSNGALGFGNGTFNYARFAEVEIDAQYQEGLIAIFMTEINPKSGNIFYHVYNPWDEIFSDSITNQTTQVVKRAVKDIKKYYSLSNFEVDFVFVTTWENMLPMSSQRQAETNTFQAVYICGWEVKEDVLADEKTAYVIFLYKFGSMNWSAFPGRKVQIGIFGPNIYIAMNANTDIVSNLDRVPGNTGYNGVISFEVGRATSDQTCNTHLYRNLDLLTSGQYHSEIHELYKCPTTLERQGAQWELYEMSHNTETDEKGYCFVIKAVAKQRFLSDNKRNKLCCYKQLHYNIQPWDQWYRTYREASYVSGHVLEADPKNYAYLVRRNLSAEQKCCADGRSSISCKRFYKIFPDLGSTDFAEFVTASALGDPHITTLDGLTYTMNGWGEYFLMEVADENFTLQARTERYEASNGVVTNATVFTAFSARESRESFFQAELSYSNRSMVLIANGIDVTRKFYDEAETSDIFSNKYLSVNKEKQSNKMIAVVSFPCGVTLKVYTAYKSLLIELLVEERLQNKTRGLLGNYNKNISDEFTLPNGETLSFNISEKEIYEKFAQKWKVIPSKSMFQYEQGKSTDDYQHADFIPLYMENTDPNKVARAEAFCGPKQDFCIFDYLVTENQAFSLNTKSTMEGNSFVANSIKNNPPTIRVPDNTLDVQGHWLVNTGSLSTIQVMGEDKDQDTISYELFEPQDGVTINQTGFITYMPDYRREIALSLRAKDLKGSYSSVLNIPISICSRCNGHGNCVRQHGREGKSGNGLFFILPCQCYPAYTGQNCDSELDACTLKPCFRGQTCIDLTAAQQGNSSVGYRCGHCPPGYTEYMDTCVDIDECNETKPCQQMCTNTEGSYKCSCNENYRLSSSDGSTCIDINECEERTSKCEQICNNTLGSYICSCYPLYTLKQDGVTCDLDTSEISLRYVCQQVGVSKENCTCRLGFEVDPQDPTLCKDIDECHYGNKPCSQKCANSLGSYLCSCYLGYKLNMDGISCEACQEPFYGENCSAICQCSGHGTCDPIRGCCCSSQWTGANCEMDVDECDKPNVCADETLCLNTVGSFKCLCPSGYVFENNTCRDLNECQEFLANMTCDLSSENCINHIGSYGCECKDGFSRNNMSHCVDIDECDAKIDECEHICQNVPGTYNCQCYQGYVLSDDRKTCLRIKNECESHNLTCSYGCQRIQNDVFECFCSKGYKLKENGDCQDINECESEIENMCVHSSLCINTNGSYNCSCRPGFKLDNDGRSCTACSSGTWGKNCANNCSCKLGADHCDPISGCVCKDGYRGIYCNIDNDECSTGQLHCAVKEKCVNVPGTAHCVCQDGYTRMNNFCQDIDECNNTLTNNCTQLCNNYEGGYSCSCFPGYSHNRNSGLCTDMNECDLETARCEQICLNTDGSYRCTCNAGFVLQTDGLTCKSILECVNKTYCSYDCIIMNNTDHCYCPKGKTLSPDLTSCDDVDLCENQHCTFGCIETELNTSYSCVCQAGHYLAPNGIDCLECIEGKWGAACASDCNCSATNTLHCDGVTGSCECKSGWTGSYCEKDVDECSQGRQLCPANSHCHNMEGSYVCRCDEGFIRRHVQGKCERCDDGFYGSSCANNCSCGENGMCGNVDGLCYCRSEWTGQNCDMDVDECSIGISKCDGGQHEVCQNTFGGFQCVCEHGYIRGCSSCGCGAIASHDVIISFNYDVSRLNFEDQHSYDYRSTLQEVQKQLLISLRGQMSAIISVTTISIRKGSLISENRIVVNSSLASDSSFHAVLQDILANGGVELFDGQVSVLGITSDGHPVTKSTCSCRDTEECDVEQETIICRPKEKKADSKNLILGLSIGLPLFVAMCIAVLIGCLYIARHTGILKINQFKRKSKKADIHAPKGEDNVYDKLSYDKDVYEL